MNRLTLFLTGLGLAFILSSFGALLWRRFYQEENQTAVQRIFKNSAVPFIARIIIRFLDLIFYVVLYSTLPGAEIGPYTFAALLVAQYLGTFTEFGLGTLLTREVAKDKTIAPQLFTTTLGLRWGLVLAAIPFAALIIGFYSLLAAFGWGETISLVGQQAIWILLLTLIPSAYSGASTALYNAAEKMEIPAFIELLTAILSIIARLLALWLGFGILGLAWAAVLVSTLTALIYLVFQFQSKDQQFLNVFSQSLHWNLTLVWQMIPLALPLMLNNLLNVVFFRFDLFLVKAFGAGQGDLLVQQYAIAYQILNIALILPPVITFAVFPTLARRADGAREALAKAQNQTLQALLLLAFPLAMALSILAPDLIQLFTRRHAADYLPISAEVLAIIAWFLPLSFTNGLLQYVLIAINQQKLITRAFLIGAFFNLSANLLLIPPFGLYAASIITILSEMVLLAVFLPLLHKEQLTPPLLKLAWRPFLATLIMGSVMLSGQKLGWFTEIALAIPVYIAMLWGLKTFGAEEKAFLRSLGIGFQD